MAKLIVGVDEAGRGPLAGPVAVAAVAVPHEFNILGRFSGLGDSKLLAPSLRERLYALLLSLKREKKLAFSVQFSSAETIDKEGIARAISLALERAVRAVAREAKDARLFLDGSLCVPAGYRGQSVIHGDEQVPVIALASVAAKVQRDRLMRRLAREFPGYGFDIHKGYATKAHREALERLGPCALHRRSFGRI